MPITVGDNLVLRPVMLVLRSKLSSITLSSAQSDSYSYPQHRTLDIVFRSYTMLHCASSAIRVVRSDFVRLRLLHSPRPELRKSVFGSYIGTVEAQRHDRTRRSSTVVIISPYHGG